MIYDSTSRLFYSVTSIITQPQALPVVVMEGCIVMYICACEGMYAYTFSYVCVYMLVCLSCHVSVILYCDKIEGFFFLIFLSIYSCLGETMKLITSTCSSNNAEKDRKY